MESRPCSLLLLSLPTVVLALPGCLRRPLDPGDRSNGDIPVLRAPRVPDGSIRIDGLLDDTGWARAGSSGPLVAPDTGRRNTSSKVNGTVRVAWDSSSLYVAFVVNDREPTSPFRAGDTDPHIWERSSGVELMVQPGDPHDNREYYELQVDTNGAVWDTRFDNENSPITGQGAERRFGHQDWVSWVRRSILVQRESGKYTIEMAIPWSSFASTRTAVPPQAGQSWRVNFYTFRDGQSDSLAWSPLLGRGNFHHAARFGRVQFAQ